VCADNHWKPVHPCTYITGTTKGSDKFNSAMHMAPLQLASEKELNNICCDRMKSPSGVFFSDPSCENKPSVAFGCGFVVSVPMYCIALFVDGHLHLWLLQRKPTCLARW